MSQDEDKVTDLPEQTLDKADEVENGASGDGSQMTTRKENLFSVVSLDFKNTPVRNKEQHRLEQILNAPIHNIPLLFVEKHEDVLPLLSLYGKKKDVIFWSISPYGFGLDYFDRMQEEDIKDKINLTGTILQYGDLPNSIPVCCDIVDYMNDELWETFDMNFLRSNHPVIIVARNDQRKDIQDQMKDDAYFSGCLEDAQTHYMPHGMCKTSELKIAPLTDDEKKVYFAHYFDYILMENGLKCSSKNLNHFVEQAIKRSEDKKDFSKIFKTLDHLIVLTKQEKQDVVSRPLIKQTLDEKLPIHDPRAPLMDMDNRLKKQIFGQDEAIDKAYETILSMLDTAKRDKPVVLGFFGPSGVGKTALAEEISKAMTGKNVVKINMGEYSESFKSSILTGSAKGYLDSDEDGFLAKAIKENPKAVILLDEFEKAHPKVQQLFLGIFDKGSVFDNHAGQIDMSDTTIILTSNAGVRSQNALGFGSDSSPCFVADEKLIQQSFAPELLGRLDAQILFKPLDDKALGKIVDKNMMSLRPRFDKLGVQVTLSKKAKEELLLEGKNPMYGARPILSLMRQKVKLPVEIGVLKKKIKKGNRVVVNSLKKDSLTVLPKLSKSSQTKSG